MHGTAISVIPRPKHTSKNNPNAFVSFTQKPSVL